jgi:hypothetical protein
MGHGLMYMLKLLLAQMIEFIELLELVKTILLYMTF